MSVDSATDRARWTTGPILGLVALAALAVWAQWSTLANIWDTGMRSEEQSHVLLVPVIAVWLIWLRKNRLALVPPRPSFLGPVVIVAGWLIARWGFVDAHLAAEHVGAILVVVGAILTLTGWAAVRHFTVLLPLIIFAVPVPGAIRSQIAMPLQTMAASITYETLVLFGVAAERMGNILVINGEQIAVAEACNGMRLVFALFLVVYAFVFSVPLRTAPRIALLVLSPAIALLCNVVRLVPTAIIFGFGTFEQATMFHDIAGWLMLVLALFILWKAVRLMEWLELPVSQLRLASR